MWIKSFARRHFIKSRVTVTKSSCHNVPEDKLWRSSPKEKHITLEDDIFFYFKLHCFKIFITSSSLRPFDSPTLSLTDYIWPPLTFYIYPWVFISSFWVLHQSLQRTLVSLSPEEEKYSSGHKESTRLTLERSDEVLLFAENSAFLLFLSDQSIPVFKLWLKTDRNLSKC